MSNKCAIIDGDFFAYYILPNKKDESGVPVEKTFEQCTNMLDQFITNILFATDCDRYIIALTIHKCFRYKIFEGYKANRKGLEKPPYFKEFTDYLITKYNAVSHPDLEADDLVLIFKELIGESSIIVSPDKDIIKCTSGKFFNPKKNEFVDTTFQEAYKNFWKSCITGDTSDGIKGIPGLGEVAANKYIDACIVISDCPSMVFGLYLDKYGEQLGIEEFYKNYKVLKIIDKHPDFDISKIKINLVENKED